ncbi:MAG TPA: heavy metal-responsive transcriptional regulator [Acidimicrobiia bacterium]|nr:heavy metal-responsive transcriptional regulator [Acidimicrobiia bacterium]
MRIGELAQQTGVSTKTIRYYEDIGLLPPPEREPNGYRDYDQGALDRLRFIRDAQATGLTLTEIASILDLRGKGVATCHHVLNLLERHLEDLDRHIAKLKETRKQLVAITQRARSLNPADCTDPIRCQTISLVENASVSAKEEEHVHAAPHGHKDHIHA